MPFTLHPNFDSKIFIADLPLCRLLLENNSHYRWLFLIPRRDHIIHIMDLSTEDQLQLLKEIDYVQKLLWTQFCPYRLNVAAIGNKTPQLHLHLIARFEIDPAWPGTVWDHPSQESYTENALQKVLDSIAVYLSQHPL